MILNKLLFKQITISKTIRYFSTSTLPTSLNSKINITNNKFNNNNSIINNNNKNDKTTTTTTIKNENEIIEYYESFVDDIAKKETRLMNWNSSHWASFKNDIEYIKSVIENKEISKLKADKFGLNSLHISIQRGFNEFATILIKSGLIDVNQRDTKPGIRLSPLHLAVNNSTPCIELIELLLENGAMVNQETTNKRTPLFKACQSSRLDIVNLLCAYGAFINIQDNPKTNGWEHYRVTTPLHISVSKGNHEIVTTLLKNGGDPNLILMDDCGESLLHVCALNGDIEMTKLLVSHGADVNQLDCFHATPLDYAQSGYKSNIDYIEFLKSTYTHIKNGKGRKM